MITSVFIAAISVGLLSFKNNDDFKIVKNLDIFYTLFRELSLFYVDETDPEDLINEGIDGMLESLDPYTTFIPESDMDDFKFMTTGEYGGIGALIRKGENYTVISEPYVGFPANKAGLKAGDIIKKIDGTSIKGKSVQQVSELLKGAPNTELKLLIERPGMDEPLEKEVIRERITISGVPYFGMLNDNTGYIRITSFTQNVSKDVKEALIKLKNDHDAEKIVLDLRSNPGGLLIEAVHTANLFVKKGQEIVSTKGKVKHWDNVYRTQHNPIDTLVPLVVLVNRSSASASEIVAGALQDLDRAVVVGQRTFGKGLVQTTRPLSYNSQLKVTTAKYYIPSGRCIQALDYTHRNEDGSVGHIPDSLISKFTTKNGRTVYDGGGIRPDIEVEPDQLSKIAISLYTKNLIFDFATLFAVKHDSIAAADEFELTDKQYDAFTKFLKNKDYDYQTRSDENLKKLIQSAKAEKYYSRAEEEFEALEKKLAHDKEKDLETFSEEIKDLLEEEIVGRYYHQKGKVQAAIDDDPQVAQAKDILENINDYHAILDGSNQKEESKVALFAE
jgi:carboxyl-terminal processing protease